MDVSRFDKEYVLKKPITVGNDTLKVIKYLDVDDLSAIEVKDLDRKPGQEIHEWIMKFLNYITHPEVSMEHIQALKKDDYAALGKFAMDFSKALLEGMGLADTTSSS